MRNRESEIRQICAERGITITRVGVAWRLSGPGVSLVTADLGIVLPHELSPVKQPDHARARGDTGGARSRG